MKLKTLKLKNFRAYREVTVNFDDLTVLVGKNDAGKSTVLEALELFFNPKGQVKYDKGDLNLAYLAGSPTKPECEIALVFDELPTQLVLDVDYPTSLADEFLLNAEGKLEIVQLYGTSTTTRTCIRCRHPTHPQCQDLLGLKNTELKKRVKELGLEEQGLNANALMRKNIRAYYERTEGPLELRELLLEVGKDLDKSILEMLSKYLPVYCLFKADRSNSDNDAEIKSPMGEAVKAVLSDPTLKASMDEIAAKVHATLEDVSKRALQKVQEMDPEAATALKPIIPKSEDLKWADLFKGFSITDGENIPLNKHGSGLKRLVLINFFRAEAERRRQDRAQAEPGSQPTLIYAMEEPETSQHGNYQALIIGALKELAAQEGTQVILTTHSARVVKELELLNVRMVNRNADGEAQIGTPNERAMPFNTLNEVNYLAFDECSPEYHNELYGHLADDPVQLDEFLSGQPKINYTYSQNFHNKKKRGTTEPVPFSKSVRDRIHHPENTANPRPTADEIAESIAQMRTYLLSHKP